MARYAAFLLVLTVAVRPATAQLRVDTVFTWQGYARTATCHLRIYGTPPDASTPANAGDRPYTVVIRELAENDGPATTADARHLAELVGRRFSLDPATAYWVFHWGWFSYPGATAGRRKELFLRATFRRNNNQSLGPPQWRLVTREAVEDYTDRHFR